MGHLLLPDFCHPEGCEDGVLPAFVFIRLRVCRPFGHLVAQSVRAEFGEVPIADDDGESAPRWAEFPRQSVTNGVSLTAGVPRGQINRGDVEVPSGTFQSENCRPSWRDFHPFSPCAINIPSKVLEEVGCDGETNASCLLGFVRPPDGGASSGGEDTCGVGHRGVCLLERYDVVLADQVPAHLPFGVSFRRVDGHECLCVP